MNYENIKSFDVKGTFQDKKFKGILTLYNDNINKYKDLSFSQIKKA